jgi:hypothetical protein
LAKLWNVVTHVSATCAALSPLEEPVIVVKSSDPRLFAVVMVNVTGAPDVFVKKFIQRMNVSLVGTKTFRWTDNAPMVFAGKTSCRLVHVGMAGTVASNTGAAPVW